MAVRCEHLARPRPDSSFHLEAGFRFSAHLRYERWRTDFPGESALSPLNRLPLVR